MERWNGKVAVVTGAGAGIGKNIALTFAKNGLIVIGLDRREDVLKDTKLIADDKFHPLKCDISDEDDVVKAFKWIEEQFGGVDILVNNAGISLASPLMTGSAEDWKAMMNINYFGLCLCTKEALKTMRARGDSGHIFHINSAAGHAVHGRVVELGLGFYTSTKHAVTALTEALRQELANCNSNIKVTSVSPGAVMTDMYATAGDGSSMPLLQVDDISEAILYALQTAPNVQVHELTVQAVGLKL